MNRVKPLLEVTRILQRVGPTNLRSVVANRHLILGRSDATLVLPVSMPVKDLSLNTVVGISGAFSPIHIAISGTFSPIHIAPPQSDIANVNKDLVPHRNSDGRFRKAHSQIKIRTLNKAHITYFKTRISGDDTAAPTPGDDNDNRKAKLTTALPHSSLTLFGSSVDDKACNPAGASVALTFGGKDDDDVDEAELSARLMRPSLPPVGLPALLQSCTSVISQISSLTRLPDVDRTQRKKAKQIRRRWEQCVKRATQFHTLAKDRNDPNKTASEWNGAIRKLVNSPEM